MIHCFCMRLANCAGIIFFQHERGLQDHRLVKAAFAIAEDEVVARALVHLSSGGNHGRRGGPLPDVAPVRAGIAVQGPAHGAGNADEHFHAGQTAVHGGRDQAAEVRAAADGDPLAVDRDPAELQRRQPQDQSRHAPVADEDIRALAQDADLDPFFVAPPQQGEQLVGIFRLGEIFRRPAQLKPGVHRQGFTLPHDVLETSP